MFSILLNLVLFCTHPVPRPWGNRIPAVYRRL